MDAGLKLDGVVSSTRRRTSHSLDCGDAVASLCTTRTITLSNADSRRKLHVTAVLRALGRQNVFSRTPSFSVSPESVLVAPTSTQDMTVAFAPDHVGPFDDELTIVARSFGASTVPGSTSNVARPEEHTVALQGRSHAHAPFVSPTGGDAQCVACDPDDRLGAVLIAGSAIAPASPIVLTFEGAVAGGDVIKRTFEVGCAVSHEKKAAEFTAELVPSSSTAAPFSIDIPKGTVEPGTRKTVTVTFTPPARMDAFTCVLADAVVVLRGGSPASVGAGVGYEVPLELRAFAVEAPPSPRMSKNDE